MLAADEEYRQLIAELAAINIEMTARGKISRSEREGVNAFWNTDLDDVIDKHRAAIARLRMHITSRKDVNAD